MIGIPIWIIRLSWHLLREKADVVIAIDFDSGLPAAVAGLLCGVPFIYNIRDNFSMRASTPHWLVGVVGWLDRFVVSRALRVIVPDENRIVGEGTVRNKFVILQNCALEVSAPPAATEGSRQFTLYAMGYIGKSRGVGVLLDLARRMPGIRVLLAGTAHEKDLVQNALMIPNVEYRGVLPVEKALELCFESDIVVTFYEPNCEINRRAISNKWSDAMMAGKPILINREVDKSKWVAENDLGYLCTYGCVDELVKLVEHIQAHPEEGLRKGANGRRMYEAGYSWSAVEARLHTLMKAVEREIKG